ncbi:rhodanese-like domain-containing protein [Ideonella sp. A 288]|uniref:rhodanese-like domain-containing protein n=1 Tax=Ideonella sp. A 288 TaxID=1962181 RepID=UPI000B4B2CF5|nr:rhodanese-like domain-containing protein [Ideonella sp. A 288]
MKTPAKTLLAAMFGALLLYPSLPTVGTALAQTTEAAQAKATWYPKRVDVAFVKEQAVLPKRDGVTLIDSRPAARKYDIGHIPTALNIPDLQFDKLAPTMLPADKSQLLIFYCDGPECMLSHNSAFKAEKLGYTNIRVYAEGFPDWIKNGNLHAVSVAHVKKLMDEKAPMTLVDARPKDRKYDKGHIPGAINLPDSQFDKLAAERLPADKAAPLYFYCDGLACKLSNDSAERAIKLGYTNVKVVPDGYPGWEKAYGPGPGAAAAAAPSAPTMVAGKEAGSITVESFERLYREAPGTVHLIDVRTPAEFASGTFKGATNVPIDTLEKNLASLPTDKPIIFFCGAGGRSGEAHDMVKMYRPELKIAFLDAQIKWTQAGVHTFGTK